MFELLFLALLSLTCLWDHSNISWNFLLLTLSMLWIKKKNTDPHLRMCWYFVQWKMAKLLHYSLFALKIIPVILSFPIPLSLGEKWKHYLSWTRKRDLWWLTGCSREHWGVTELYSCARHYRRVGKYTFGKAVEENSPGNIETIYVRTRESPRRESGLAPSRFVVEFQTRKVALVRKALCKTSCNRRNNNSFQIP